ncbi:DNA polymerase III subunit beta [Fodinisporobacter ferrooxydans]|uniref:Beta sliding clamp n=1 Tax=Fodinisporobacter ferrooxydans TaxID=2901836 RepID=A0ABY4CRD1_9BACL|nr:DNA polymerase III subunit beta [Alicyclobacillaceae bacterium MYW30-H2]
MHITIDRSHFLTAIQSVQKAISTKTTIPILTGIKLSVTEQGLKMTATDLQIGIETIVQKEQNGETILQIHQLGSIVLTAKYLGEIVRKLPQATVDIEVKQNYLTIIRSGTSEFNLHGLDAEEFPRLPQVTGNQVFSIPSDLLKDMIRQTVYAVSTEEIRPVLTGVVWSLKEGNLKFVATDSHRLASRKVQVEAPEEMQLFNIIVPGKSLLELGRLLSEDDTLVDIVVADNQVLIHMGRTQFYSRLLEGQYPDTTRIIPNTYKTAVQVKTKDLLDAVERAALIAKDNDNNVVRFNIKQMIIDITSNSPDVGKVSETLKPIQVSGEDMIIACNAKYLIEALRVITSPEITVEFTGSMSPILLKPLDNPGYLTLVLPVRIY